MAKRRTRSPSPGVVLIRPDPAGEHPTWRARYVDPDTGRTTKERLDPVTLGTAEARRDWAIRKSKALTRRRFELEAGAHPKTGTSLADAVDTYFTDHPQLRPRTLEIYKVATRKLKTWAERNSARSADDLTGPKLVAFRATLVREPKRKHVKGGKRGALESVDDARAPSTINQELRAVGTVLGYLRSLGLLPRLTGDDLRDGLKKLAVSIERLEYLRPAELQKLLDAALRHDAAMFKATRDEHAGEKPRGTTPRYQPVAPLVAAAMLTGMRFGELVALTWKHVDLEALDHDGKVVGEIYVTAASKTKRARTVGLEVSPALRKLLAAMHLSSGGTGSVFGFTEGEAKSAERRLRDEFGAPAGAGWQVLRQTCGTYLTNAPGIFGASSAYRSAKQLGHSVAVAERHYVGLVRGIPREARTLEAAMQVDAQMKRGVASASAAPIDVRHAARAEFDR